jgi:hypothetical protein
MIHSAIPGLLSQTAKYLISKTKITFTKLIVKVNCLFFRYDVHYFCAERCKTFTLISWFMQNNLDNIV